MQIDRESIKGYIYANMFDGAKGGITTMSIDYLVDEMATIVFFIFDDLVDSMRPKDYEEDQTS